MALGKETESLPAQISVIYGASDDSITLTRRVHCTKKNLRNSSSALKDLDKPLEVINEMHVQVHPGRTVESRHLHSLESKVP